MSKLAKANVVYSGWMVKSPPEKKFRLTGAWKIFRAFSQDASDTSKWKRRYFVLFKPASSLPHQYLLHYYTDENLKKLKGCIDLEHCEQVIESLDLETFPYLLALKTYHKGRERTYFLATDTEDQMSTWVRNLCSVCGLKPEDNAELPPDRTEVEKVTSGPTSPNVVALPPRSTVRSPPVTTQPHNDVQMRPSHGRPASCSKTDSRYIPISECYSGKNQPSPPDRRYSVDSIPDELAPPPPLKAPRPIPAQHNEDDVFHNSTYDTPPKKRDASDDEESYVYKVPPVRPHRNDNHNKDETTLDVYDVPPPTRQSPSTPRSSSSESQKADSAYSSQSGLTYDYPPSHGGERTLTADDVYDTPPSNPQMVSHNDLVTDAPPPRPPKSSSVAQDPYQNLPPTAKVYQRATKNSMDLNKVIPASVSDGSNLLSYDVPPPPHLVKTTPMYDMPKPHPQSVNSKDPSSLLAIPPPPKSCSGQASHSYINAAKGYVPIVDEKREDVYLPMERAFPPSDSLNNNFKKSIDLNYADMSGSSGPDGAYTDMSGTPPEYDMPPARPPPARVPRISPRQHHHDQGIADTYTIFSTPRTRSFKRHGSSSSDHRVEAPMTLRVELPSRSGENRHPDFSTSSEDEDDVLGDPSQSQSLWGRTPPAPSRQEAELKYLDLELEDNADREPMRSPHSHTGHSTPTDYREIDFVKTQALSDVKKSVDDQRKPQH